MACHECQRRAGTGECEQCRRAYYCSRRCQALAWYVHEHPRVCAPLATLAAQVPPVLPPLSPEEQAARASSVDADALVLLARRAVDNGSAPSISGQVPPHVWSWSVPDHPRISAVPVDAALVLPLPVDGIISARPESVGLGLALLEPRLIETAYVLFGVADMDVYHPAPAGHPHRAHYMIGRAQLAQYGGPDMDDAVGMGEWARALGGTWARLHYGVGFADGVTGCDGTGAWVVIGRPRGYEVDALWLTVDASRCARGRDGADAEQRARAMMLLPLVPQPLEAPALFAAFAHGYRDEAREYHAIGEADAVLDALQDWTTSDL